MKSGRFGRGLGIVLLLIPGGWAGTAGANFGAGGIVTLPVAGSDEQVESVLIQPDGKIVAAGYSDNGVTGYFMLARFNVDGTLDVSFNGTGQVTTSIGGTDDGANSAALQPDGKIVAAGYSYSGGKYNFALARYNSNGSLDTAFNGTGKVTTSMGSTLDTVYSVALQSDGKIVAAGSSYGSHYDFALARYNSDGGLDTTFNTTGKVITPIGVGGNFAYSVILQSDGKIAVAGYADTGSTLDFALARYNSNGTLDTGFNGTGKVTTGIGTSDSNAYSLLQQADGKLVAAGSATLLSRSQFVLARYTSAGMLDSTFNAAGIAATDFSANSYGTGLVMQPDQKLAVAGWTLNSSNDFALARYNSNGSPDTTFNGTGKVTTQVSLYSDGAKALALQSDGKLVAAGWADSGTDDDFALVRYNSDGTLDNATPTATSTPSRSGTPTRTFTRTAAISATPTFTRSSTSSPTHSRTSTCSATGTPTFSQSPTWSSTCSSTATATFTSTPTAVISSSPTPALTFEPTLPPVFSNTPTQTASLTASIPSTGTPTPVPPGPSPSRTPAASLTSTPGASIATAIETGVWNPGQTVRIRGNVLRGSDPRAVTWLDLNVPSHTNIRIVLYDQTGQKICDLADQWAGPGMVRFSWDGRDAGGRPVPPGIYLARIQFEGTNRKERILVIR